MHNDAHDYLRSALIGYQLLVHEFGPGIAVEFAMNCDFTTPMLRLHMDDMPDDALARIDRICETMRHLMPATYAHHVMVSY